MIRRRKNEYQNHLALKFNNSTTSAKTYWSISNLFYNSKKALIIPSFLINDKPISDFEKKGNYFNSFFCISSNTIYKFENNDIINPLSANPTKWSNTPKQFVGNLPTNCLSVFDHFMNLALKELT